MQRALLILLAFVTGCSSQAGPSIATPPISFGSVAVLAVTTFEGTLAEVRIGRYLYRVKLVLAETSRKSNATITGITIRMPGGGSASLAGPDCFAAPPLVRAGEGWDADGANPPCLVLDSDGELTTASVNVTFLDDVGTLGTVSAVGPMHR